MKQIELEKRYLNCETKPLFRVRTFFIDENKYYAVSDLADKYKLITRYNVYKLNIRLKLINCKEYGIKTYNSGKMYLINSKYLSDNFKSVIEDKVIVQNPLIEINNNLINISRLFDMDNIHHVHNWTFRTHFVNGEKYYMIADFTIKLQRYIKLKFVTLNNFYKYRNDIIEVYSSEYNELSNTSKYINFINSKCLSDNVKKHIKKELLITKSVIPLIDMQKSACNAINKIIDKKEDLNISDLLRQAANDIDNKQNEINKINEQLSFKEDEILGLNTRINILNIDITDKSNLVNNLTDDIKNKNSEIDSLKVSKHNLKKEIDRINDTINQRNDALAELNSQYLNSEKDLNHKLDNILSYFLVKLISSKCISISDFCQKIGKNYHDVIKYMLDKKYIKETYAGYEVVSGYEGNFETIRASMLWNNKSYVKIKQSGQLALAKELILK